MRMFKEVWQPAIQYDKVDMSAVTSDSEWITLALSYFPLENMRIAAYYRTNEGESAPGVDARESEFFINIRIMF